MHLLLLDQIFMVVSNRFVTFSRSNRGKQIVYYNEVKKGESKSDVSVVAC